MSATVAASLITGLLSLAGVVLSNLLSERRRENALRTAQAVTDEQLRELTREVREHNHFARRMPVVEEQIKVINHRLEDLEKGGAEHMINWKVRFQNRNFWLALVPALLLLLQSAAALAGIDLDLGALQGRLLDFVNAAFGVLAILGIVNDPTTQGLTDSPRALGYRKPN